MQKSDYGFTVVKQEIDGQVVLVGDKTPKADHMYMKVIVIPALSKILYVELSISLHIPNY